MTFKKASISGCEAVPKLLDVSNVDVSWGLAFLGWVEMLAKTL
jgi:hypothetical protein